MPAHNPLDRLLEGIYEKEARERRSDQRRLRAEAARATKYPTLPMQVDEGDTWRIPPGRYGLLYERLTALGVVSVPEGAKFVVIKECE
jgi:hypothetical protein